MMRRYLLSVAVGSVVLTLIGCLDEVKCQAQVTEAIQIEQVLASPVDPLAGADPFAEASASAGPKLCVAPGSPCQVGTVGRCCGSTDCVGGTCQ